ncbi:MAG: ComF family protein [Lachnospirales bacterium]
MKIHNISGVVLDFFYPPKCHICGSRFNHKKYKRLCPNCVSVILNNQNIERCKKCSKILNDDNCTFCGVYDVYDNLSIFSYDGYLKSIYYDVKYSGNKHICKETAYLYEDYIKENMEFFKKFDYITSVPLHPKKLFKRGFNQSEVLAKEFSKMTQIPFCSFLIRSSHTKPQNKLSFKGRQDNVKSAFRYNNLYTNFNIKDKNILIVDDIFTSGSTIKECGRILENRGARISSITLMISNN